MRAFLTAFACLSILAMAQSVVVATPVVSPTSSSGEASSMRAASDVVAERFVASPPRSRGEVPAASTMALLVAGLSGLCAVGGRQHDRRHHSA